MSSGRAHFAYAGYVIRHKWFVLRAGLRIGAPLWRLVIHDYSKLTPAEWGPYVREFYDPLGAKKAGEFDRAWLHHIHRNPHHWQHWILRMDDAIGGIPQIRVLRMPDGLVHEMVADWMGATRTLLGHWDAAPWYHEHAANIVLDGRARDRAEQLLGIKLPLSVLKATVR